MGAGASSDEASDTDKVHKLKLRDDLKKREQEIAVLKQKIGNLKSDLLHERQKKESTNVTSITTTESMAHSRLKIFWYGYKDYHSFRVLWLTQELKKIKELKSRVENDFEFVPDIHDTSDQHKTGSQDPKSKTTTDRENTRSTTSSRNDVKESGTQKIEEINSKSSPKNTSARENSKVSKSSQNSHANKRPGNHKPGKEKQDSNLSRSEDGPPVNNHGAVLALVGPKFTDMLQSPAICMYIAEKYGKLVPAIKYRSKYYEFILYAANSLDVLLDNCNEYWIKDNISTELDEKIKTQFKNSMAFLSSRLDKKYICGENFTVADCVIGCSLHYLVTTYQGSTPVNEKVMTYLSQIRGRESFMSSLALMGKRDSPDY